MEKLYFVYAIIPDRRKAADSLIKKLNALTDAGYQKFKGRQEQGQIRIENHAKVAPGGHLHYGHSRDGDRTRGGENLFKCQ